MHHGKIVVSVSRIGVYFCPALQVAQAPHTLRAGQFLSRTHSEVSMSAFVIFDVDIHNPERYQDFIRLVKPAIESAGARYLARGGTHKVHEGDWSPRRIVLIEFPSVQAWESFYNGPVYQGFKAVRDECSSARLVCVEGLAQ